ncbi:MAG TPA: FAD-dependent monooxygenase [Microlunatus sp.]
MTGSVVRVLNTDFTVAQEMLVGQPADIETQGRHLRNTARHPRRRVGRLQHRRRTGRSGHAAGRAPLRERLSSPRTGSGRAPWSSGPVTVIGDAAHPMIPAGIGAAVALADAAALSDQLAAAAARDQDLITAVANYERQMIKDGFDAVEQSERRFC